MSTGKGSSDTIITRQPWTLYPPEAGLPLTLHYQRDGRMTARHGCTSTVSLSITQMTEKTAGDRAGQSARGLFWGGLGSDPPASRDRTARSSSCWAQKKKGKKMSLSFARCFNEDSTKTITGSVTLSDIWKCCRSWGWGDGGLLDALKWEPYGNAIEHFAIVKLQWGAGFAFSILHSWQLFKLSREQRI